MDFLIVLIEVLSQLTSITQLFSVLFDILRAIGLVA